jgi:hypothetical protein
MTPSSAGAEGQADKAQRDLDSGSGTVADPDRRCLGLGDRGYCCCMAGRCTRPDRWPWCGCDATREMFSTVTEKKRRMEVWL